MMTILNISDYLQRIGCPGDLSLSPTLETLSHLNLQHICHIPFENIDVFRPQSVLLESAYTVEKLINSKRGGYCFELNQLLSELLERLGYHVTRHLGRVWRNVTFPVDIISQTHQVSVVTLQGVRYLVDVGFGPSGLFYPLAMQEGAEQQRGNFRFRYRFHDEFGHLLEGWIEKAWRVLYSFTDAPAYPADYQMANFYVSRSPDQFLHNNMVCSLLTSTDRKIIFAKELRLSEGGEKRISQIDSREHLQAVLYEHFMIELPEDARIPGYDFD
ncbi:MAG: arylamine N-acetyltransferase family protein [Enterobacteriaceae bacterium]